MVSDSTASRSRKMLWLICTPVHRSACAPKRNASARNSMNARSARENECKKPGIAPGHVSKVGFSRPRSSPYTPGMEYQTVSKLDAATRQLHMAIRLYFQDDDPLGVHTLAGAAHGILADLAGKHGYGSGFQRDGAAGVQADQHAFVVRMIKDARVFLKHANRDPDAALKFNPDWTDFLLFDAIRMHLSITAKIDLVDSIFLVWLSTKYPSVLLLDTTIFAPTAAGLRQLFSSHEGSEKKRLFFKAIAKSQVLSKPADAKGKPKAARLKLVPKP
jgi:hypothetical protein